MHAQPLESGRPFLVKHCARQVRGKVIQISRRVNIEILGMEAAERLQMNDIAVLEIETSRPLFFDSYRQNRTTGSFIVVDPLTNATLGAGMIQEDLSTSAEILAGQETLIPAAPIAPHERHRRHGHHPAIILVNARAALSRRLERALFEEGFEVMFVEENPSDPLAKNIWPALHAAGFVVMYHNPSLAPDESSHLKAAAGENFFDLAELELPVGDEEAVERLLSLAESLRIPRGFSKLGR
jgi:hypothetical protein